MNDDRKSKLIGRLSKERSKFKLFLSENEESTEKCLSLLLNKDLKKKQRRNKLVEDIRKITAEKLSIDEELVQLEEQKTMMDKTLNSYRKKLEIAKSKIPCNSVLTDVSNRLSEVNREKGNKATILNNKNLKMKQLCQYYEKYTGIVISMESTYLFNLQFSPDVCLKFSSSEDQKQWQLVQEDENNVVSQRVIDDSPALLLSFYKKVV